MIKSRKGITLVVLAVTIVVMLLLSGVVFQYSGLINATQDYDKMKSDIEILEDKILIYYNMYGELPTTGDVLVLSNLPSNGIYKEVNLTKLSNVTLNYGNKARTEDYYAIDINSHNVYYVEGITLNNITYYSN